MTTPHGVTPDFLRENAREWHAGGASYEGWVSVLMAQFGRVTKEDVAAGVARERVDAAARQSLESVATVLGEVWGVTAEVQRAEVGGLAGYSLRVLPAPEVFPR
jgi:hypothetical protein